MPPLPSHNPQSDPRRGELEQIANALLQRHWRPRQGKDGRSKLRGSCLFHSDVVDSADFYPDDGWYYCFGCARSYTPEEVATELGLEIKNGQGTPGHAHPATSDRVSGVVDEFHHNRYGWPNATYTYRFPVDGRISHYKHRFQLESNRKTFAIQGPAPDYLWKKPEPFWPVYGDYLLPQRLNVILVEGEKAQQAIGHAQELHQGILIVALTCGSAGDFKDPKNRKTLIERLQQLNPNRILVWPDNDVPGKEWAEPLHRQAKALGLPIALVNIRALPLELAEGADDFLSVGGSLNTVFEREFQQVGGFTVDQIIEKAIVTNTEKFMLPGTRRLYPIIRDNTELLYFRTTGDPNPQPKITQRLKNELRSRSADQGVEVYYRRWHDRTRTQLAWRAQDSGFAYHISKAGQAIIEDPPHSLLVLPEGEAHYSVKVDEGGTRADLEALLGLFDVKGDDVALIEGWLLCALLGLLTPILLLRGEAGSGKTTLARALIGIIEPTVPAVNLGGNQRQADVRALIEGLRQSIAMVLDNVSMLIPEAEDLLCQFVTGFSIMHRQLYENRVENLSMQRAIVITTTNWNVSKGDLSTRIIAIRMRTRNSYRDENQINALIQPLIEKIRGYLFRAAQYYYQNVSPNSYSQLRMADMGKVFRALGYDADRLESYLAYQRGQVVNETSPWHQGVIAWYRDLELRVGESREVKFEDIKGAVEAFTHSLFPPGDTRFGIFLNESDSVFRDLGFSLVRKRTARERFWIITKLREELLGDD